MMSIQANTLTVLGGVFNSAMMDQRYGVCGDKLGVLRRRRCCGGRALTGRDTGVAEGVLSYSMPQGQRRGAEVDLLDLSYDGRAENDYLSGGLGQLIDSELGHANFRLDPTGVGKKGYEWVGWKNESTTQPPIDILFEFDAVRNFSAVRVHCNNMFTKDVRVPKRAVVSFSVGGKYFRANDAVTFDYMRDTLIEYARQVIIPVAPPRLARYVQLKLFFDDRWMMISEVRFESGKASDAWSCSLVSFPL
jgi:discoidin domain receptor family protein 2